jgi:predicted kinase
MLIVLGGLPGVGKTTIARELARRLGGVHIRIDSIEQAIRESGVTDVSIDDAGYRVGYAVTEDNLRLGRIVIADSVNPLPITRDAWLAVAHRAAVTAVEVEVACSTSRNIAAGSNRGGARFRDSVDQPGMRWLSVTLLVLLISGFA